MQPPPRLRRRLAELSDLPVNYDVSALNLADPPAGWLVDHRRHPLPAEPPGEPVPDGSWQTAGALIRGYEFADPSMVRAFYDPDAPLQGRNMLLELRTLQVVSIHVGVRVATVYDEQRAGLDPDGRPGTARVFGWGYRTLRGHVESGQMDWQVWKWLDTGAVEFRVDAVSRVAAIYNPVIWLGFHLLRGHERRVFLDSTGTRMQRLTERALGAEDPERTLRQASPELTVRSSDADDPAHAQLARRLRDQTRPRG